MKAEASSVMLMACIDTFLLHVAVGRSRSGTYGHGSQRLFVEPPLVHGAERALEADGVGAAAKAKCGANQDQDEDQILAQSTGKPLVPFLLLLDHFVWYICKQDGTDAMVVGVRDVNALLGVVDGHAARPVEARSDTHAVEHTRCAACKKPEPRVTARVCRCGRSVWARCEGPTVVGCAAIVHGQLTAGGGLGIIEEAQAKDFVSLRV